MIRSAVIADIPRLVEIEKACFETDQLSRRNFRHMLTKAHAITLVAEEAGTVQGYVLVLFHRGTSLARLYSIAVSTDARKGGVGRHLVTAAEEQTLTHDCVTMRLEIRADNTASIKLFEGMGYRCFGRYLKYYQDQSDAVRLEKRLVTNPTASMTTVPYYQQTLDFTCGPASLMMAMKALQQTLKFSRHLELRVWRESTTIFMTSGHGGCGPYGLALSAYHRGFKVEVYLKDKEPLFIDTVRSAEKKEVIRLVEQDFRKELSTLPVAIKHHRLTGAEIIKALEHGGVPVILISSYRIYREKSPHWVVVTGYDERFIYVHDPYIDEEKGKTVSDCVNMPILKTEFERMSRYGKSGQRAALIIYKS